MRELTKDALATYPGPLNYGQNFSNPTLVAAFKKSANPKPQRKQTNLRGRGGGQTGRRYVRECLHPTTQDDTVMKT